MNLTETAVAGIVSATLDEVHASRGFNYSAPQITLSGPGSSVRLGRVLADMGYSSVYIVSDQAVSQLGLVDGMLRTCKQWGLVMRIYDQVTGEPCTDLVQQLLLDYRRDPADVIIGVGGGSAMDAAKALAVMAGDSAVTLPLLAQGQVPWRRSVGLVCVPTTAGTGTEATNVTVIMESDHSTKHLIIGQSLMPDVAVLDAALMQGLPPAVTAGTGIDALTHAIEAYVAREANPLSKDLAFGAVRTIMLRLPTAVGNGDDFGARDDLALAAYKAGLAFSNSGLGLVHAMSHAAGARYGIPHGLANAMLLTEVMRFNMLVCQDAFAELAIAMGVATDRLTQRERALAAIDSVATLLDDIGVPEFLGDYEVCSGDLPALAQLAMQDVCLASNPRQVSSQDIVKLYHKVLIGS